MKSPISNETTNRIRYRNFDYSDRVVTGSADRVARMFADSVSDVWIGRYNYTVHERLISGDWIVVDECRC